MYALGSFLLLLGIYFVVFSSYQLYQAITHRNEAPMMDMRDARSTAEEIHRRLKRRYFATMFNHHGDFDYMFWYWAKHFLKKAGPNALVGLVLLCHACGCEIVIEDDEEPADDRMTDGERERALDYASDVPAMDDSDLYVCLVKRR